MSLALKTEFFKDEDMIVYTNNTGSTITAGTPLAIGGKIYIPPRDIPDTKTDELFAAGRFRGVKANETWAAGDRVGWNATGNPAVGTAGSGCWTNVQANWTAGFPSGGIVEVAAAAGDELGIFRLNEFKDNIQVQGIAGGYKIARGQGTTVTASDTIVTGLATVIAALAVLDDSPVIGCDRALASIGDQAGTPAAGSILLKTFKPTATGDATPIAATTFTKKVNWLAIGT